MFDPRGRRTGTAASSRRGRRRSALIGVIVAVLVVSASAVTPAFADSTVDQILWANCQAESSGSLSFDTTSLNWLDSTVMRYSVTVGHDCNELTQARIIEDTPQANDSPQVDLLGWGGGGGFSTSGADSVTPLRSLTWSLYLSGPLGTKTLAPADPGTTTFTITYPNTPLPDNPPTVTITDNSADSRWKFVRAVQTAGTTVTVAGSVNLDLSGLDGIQVAPNVQILGDRGVNPQGPLLFTTTEPRNLFVIPPRTGSHERISGIRLRGGSSTDPFQNLGDEDSNGILAQKPNVEIDHNEIYLWRGAGVDVEESCDTCALLNRPVAGDNSSTVWVHDNYIHHDQHPTGDICCGHGGGYGVEVGHGGYALVEDNAFDYNRHSMTAGGQTGTGYLFYRNLILPHGGVNSWVSSTHAIDVHGSNPDDSFESGQAGEYFDVAYNTVWNINAPAIKLRGTPTDQMVVTYNVFAHCGIWAAATTGICVGGPPAIVENEVGLTEFQNRAAVRDDARTGCDFDGDGVNDTFHATGVTWWFQSSRLAGRYVYLHQSTSVGAAISLANTNSDGLCDVVENGTAVLTNPDATIGPGLWTPVPLLVGTSDAVAKAGIAAAHLTVGTITTTPSPLPVGTVVDQSPHTNYVRAKGWPVNLVESAGGASVPYLLGEPQTTAEHDIDSAGLVHDTTFTNNCVDTGSVQNQNPAGGTLVAPGTTVHITVSTCSGGGGGIEK